jgi:DnaJ-class molecular chaperone
MAASKDYYQILAVKREATARQLKAAFRKKAMRYHPDHNPGKEDWANKKLRSIIESYETLSDPAKRKIYDQKLALAEATSIRMEPRRQQPKTAKKVMVDIMRHGAVPVWARTAAFAYVFFDYLSRESRRAE